MTSAPATGIESAAPAAAAAPVPAPSWLFTLLQSGDSFYPTGSYAHSFGLEGLVQEDVVRDRVTLGTFLTTSLLPGLGRIELPLLAHAARAFAVGDWAQLAGLSALSPALRPARELRAASEAIGRQRAELAALLHPRSVAPEYLTRATAGGWSYSAPVSAALEAHLCGAPPGAALTACTYATLAGVIAAAMKLLRLGQNSAQQLLVETAAAAGPLIAAAESIPVDEIGWFNPWLEIASARHERADGRMFIS